MTTATPITEAFEARYQRSAEDPTSAEMLAIFSEGWNARGTFPEALMPEPFGYVLFGNEFYPPDQLDAEVKEDPFVPAVYTADQLHEAIRAATERAAKLCDAESKKQVKKAAANDGRDSDFAFGASNAAEFLAAAIRASGGMGASDE